MNNDIDLLETNGIVSTKLFNIKNTKTLPIYNRNRRKVNDTQEYLNRRLYTREPINIVNKLSQPWPVHTERNNRPVISNTVSDIVEDKYARYRKYYVSLDSSLAEPDSNLDIQKYVTSGSTRYVINLGKTYNDVYKIKLVDFGLSNLNTGILPYTEPAPSYILLRIQAVNTADYGSATNFQVANSLADREVVYTKQSITTGRENMIRYHISEPFQTSIAKIKIFKPLPQGTLPTNDDIIEPVFYGSELLYYDSPLENLNKILVTFYENNGAIYDDMPPNNFTLEIIEKINVLKNTNINTKDGEVEQIGLTKNNPLLF